MLGDNGAETAGIAPPPKLPANEPKLGAEKSGLLRLRAGGPILRFIYRISADRSQVERVGAT